MGVFAPAIIRKLRSILTESELVIVYHGGTFDGSRAIDLVCYFATSREMAESYLEKSDDPDAQVRAFELHLNNPAPQRVVLETARYLGMENPGYTPASLFDQDLFDNVGELVSTLARAGYDAAICEDIGYGVQVSEPVYVVWDASKVFKVG